MSTSPRHFKDELQDWLDGRLDAETCVEVERHVEMCAECRREYEAMWWTKKFASKHYAPTEAPEALRANLLAAIRTESSTESSLEEVSAVVEPIRPATFWQRYQRPLWAAAALLVASLFIVALSFVKRPLEMPEIAAQDYRAYQAQALAMELSTSSVAEMTTYFAGHGVAFNTRVFDLGMMNYQLEGGRVQTVGSSPRALFSYRGTGKQKLVCQMYVGQVTTLPKGSVLRENKGLAFHVYQVRGVTAVFWQEGAVVCVLTSDIPLEEVLQLAFAKAMP